MALSIKASREGRSFSASGPPVARERATADAPLVLVYVDRAIGNGLITGQETVRQ